MDRKLPRISAEAMMEEVSSAELGDERLDRRFVEIMGALARSPNASFARLFEEESGVEATYRFMRNPSVAWQDLLEPHAEQTARRCRKAGSVLVVHDTTTNRISDEAELESYINTGKKGFLAHTSLAVENGDGYRPLGVLEMQCVFRPKKKARTKKNGRKKTGAETAKLKNREYDRWAKGIEACEGRLDDSVEAIHLTDREGDSFGFFAPLVAGKDKRLFVIRECKNRSARLVGRKHDEWKPVHELLEKAKKTRIRREVHLSRRDKKTAPGNAKANPVRAARWANLNVSYLALELRKPRYLRTTDKCPETVQVNFVHVYEKNPPEGAQRIEWVLFTNLPVANDVQAEQVVDTYLRRWLIEEFFAALKGGCRYRERRLTNPLSILNTLACLLPIAWKALELRQLARTATGKASDVFDAIQLRALRAKARQLGRPFGKTVTAQEALSLIARLGGHRKSSGPPGWRTLMKGMDKFLSIAEGYALATEKM